MQLRPVLEQPMADKMHVLEVEEDRHALERAH